MGSTATLTFATLSFGLGLSLYYYVGGAGIQQMSSEVLQDSERAADFFQCDRQCRWSYGFFDRTIIGKRRAKAGSLFDNHGKYCQCYDSKVSTTDPLDSGKLIPRLSKKSFDSVDTWSGDFSSQFVCTAKPQGGLETMKRDQAVKQKREILHCGKCSVCSAKDDVVVLSLTRKWITEVMTAGSVKFAKPGFMGGTGDLARLQADLSTLGMNFSMTPQEEFGGSSCMECWTDNIMNDANTCKGVCWTKFIKPSNPMSNITNCHPLDFNCLCLKCDEDNSGAPFIKCAGANRRSTGIVSDIARPESQQCKVGKYYGVPAAQLPSSAEPSKEEIDRVLNGPR